MLWVRLMREGNVCVCVCAQNNGLDPIGREGGGFSAPAWSYGATTLSFLLELGH